MIRFAATTCALALAGMAVSAPVKMIFDTDMLTDFDDVGALACLHALADAGECEILATVSSTRGNASVGAVEVINHYYGRPDIPVGSPKGMGVVGSHPGAKAKVDPVSPLCEKAGGDGGHYKYRKLLADYPGWYRHADADDAPDANEVYRRVLAAQPDGSVTICSVGFLTNIRRLLETKPDDISPLDGKALVAKKVKLWVAMACQYPAGKEYNSMWDAESSRIALENWPTPIIFSDFQYGRDCFAGRAIAESPADGRNPFRRQHPVARGGQKRFGKVASATVRHGRARRMGRDGCARRGARHGAVFQRGTRHLPHGWNGRRERVGAGRRERPSPAHNRKIVQGRSRPHHRRADLPQKMSCPCDTLRVKLGFGILSTTTYEGVGHS